jgi:tol-pal system protein YbgF
MMSFSGKIALFFLLSSGMSTFPLAIFADVPVIDGASSSDSVTDSVSTPSVPSNSAGDLPLNSANASAPLPASPPVNLTMPQRVSKLEQQMTNLNQVDLNNQIQALKQKIDGLQGKIDMQNHQLDQLKQEQLTMYKDLNTRVAQFPAQAGQKSLAANDMMDQKQDKKNTSDISSTNSEDEKTKHSQPSIKPAFKSTDNNSSVSPIEETEGTSALKSTGDLPSSPAISNKEQTAYQVSYGFIKRGEYPKAILSLKKYIKEYPSGTYTASAHYWLGEIYYIENDTKNALVQFQSVLQHFPKDPKAADAKLKMGFIHFDNGETRIAKKYLNEVVKQYPDSSAAKLATSRLQQIAKLK